MSEAGLTKRQQEVLDYIRHCLAEKQCPPTVREICNALGLRSPSTVQSHIKALVEKGYIKRDGAKSRSVSLTSQSKEPTAPAATASSTPSHDANGASLITLPLVGRVAAGTPILAESNVEEEVSLPVSIFGDSSSFLLTVSGESMIEAGIFDGDTLLVKEQQTADDGDIVVALLDDSATVKTFYRERDCIRLQPQNASMEPIYTRDVKILGVVTGLFRRM